jgi:hypothetical protein
MHGRFFLAVAAAVTTACSHAAVNDTPIVSCSVSAISGRPAGLTGKQACDLVQERVEAGVAAQGSAVAPSIAIALDLSRPGSVIARIRLQHGDNPHSAHEIAVDVMDRTLVRDDVVRLADAVTQTILSEMQGS